MLHSRIASWINGKKGFFFLPWVARLTICFLSVKKSTNNLRSSGTLVNFYFWNTRHKEKNFARVKWMYRFVTKRDKIVVSFLNINRTWANSIFDKESKKCTSDTKLLSRLAQTRVMRVLDGGRASMAAPVHCKLDGVLSPLSFSLSYPFVGLSNLSFGIKDTVQTSGISENFTETNRAGHKFRTASGIVISFSNDLAQDHFSIERITLTDRNRFSCTNAVSNCDSIHSVREKSSSRNNYFRFITKERSIIRLVAFQNSAGNLRCV